MKKQPAHSRALSEIAAGDTGNQKTVFLVSLGCPKNLVDSEVMLGQLEKAAYRVCQEPEEADLLLINTCGFIQEAVEEGIGEILQFAELKRQFPEKKLVVTGCLVQRYGSELQKELPEVDLFLGTDGFQDLTAHLRRLSAGPSFHRLEQPEFLLDSQTERRPSTPPHRAYLKVTEGCANRCAYCLIPSIRGPLRSRSIPDVCREARALEAAGTRELTLIAQDLTSFGLEKGGESQLVPLLRELLAGCDIPWLRLLYLHPVRVNEELLRLMADSPRLLPYLDIPLQHVNSRLLRAMNRPYDRSYIEELLAGIRAMVPGAALRTTFLVGFPGETESMVDELENFLLDQQFDHVGIFAYSNEEGAPAATLPDHCAEGEKAARRRRLMACQAEIASRRNRRFAGTIEEVLVEGISKETELLLEGRTRYQAPEIDGTVYITAGNCQAGDLVDVRITETHTYDLVGEIISETES